MPINQEIITFEQQFPLMKRLLLLLIFLPSLAHGQFYLGANGSFNIASGGRSIGEFLLMNATVDQGAFINTVTENKVSFGGGMHVSPILGYRINDYVGIEVQGTMFNTKRVWTTILYSNPADNRVDIKMAGNFSSIRPSLIGYVYKKNPLIYVKAGAVYSVGEFVLEFANLSMEQETTTLISGGRSVGVSFGVGADFLLTKRLCLRTELNHINANYFPKIGEFTQFDISGVNQLPSMNAEEKVINFVREGYVSETYLGAGLESGTLLSPQIPISSFGLNMSVIYKFNKRSK